MTSTHALSAQHDAQRFARLTITWGTGSLRKLVSKVSTYPGFLWVLQKFEYGEFGVARGCTEFADDRRPLCKRRMSYHIAALYYADIGTTVASHRHVDVAFGDFLWMKLEGVTY